MSALNARQNEPTMDEILASIRKIISDDLGEGNAAAVVAQPEPMAEVFELSTQMALPAAREPAWNMPLTRRGPTVAEPQMAASAPKLDPVSAVTELAARMARMSTQAEAVAVKEPEAVTTAPVSSPKAPMASETASAVSSAFGSLRQTIERETVADAAVASAMQMVVESALRPMLKDWIDAHLPSMVERLVKAEIERMAKKG
jgi:cell pole-organizing protein PopZ